MNLLYHPLFKEELSEISSFVRQCQSRNINYDDNIVKIKGDVSDISDMSVHNDENLSDHSVIDEEYIPFDETKCDIKTCLKKKHKKRCL